MKTSITTRDLRHTVTVHRNDLGEERGIQVRGVVAGSLAVTERLSSLVEGGIEGSYTVTHVPSGKALVSIKTSDKLNHCWQMLKVLLQLEVEPVGESKKERVDWSLNEENLFKRYDGKVLVNQVYQATKDWLRK